MRLPTVDGLRRALSRMSARQWTTLLAGLVVAAGMVVTAERGRESADLHRRVQVLAERVRATSQELNAVNAQGLALMAVNGRAVGPAQLQANQRLVIDGFAAWRELSATLGELRGLQGGSQTAGLQRDARALYTAGMQELHAVEAADLKSTLSNEDMVFRPALQRLDADAKAAARAQQSVAQDAATRSSVAFIASLALGLALLILISWRFHRLRRDAELAAERHAVERRSEHRVRALVDRSADVVTVIGRDLCVRWQAASMQRVLGHDPGLLVGAPLTCIAHPDDVEHVERNLVASVERPGETTFSARFQHALGGWRHIETVTENRLADPAVEGVILSMRDVSERKALEDELRHQAFHDALTGLANRALFEDRLAHAAASARRYRRSLAVLLLDLDDFKTINDSLGHARGDELLRSVALRISSVLRQTDTAARLGGDEFAVVLEALDSDCDAEAVAKKIVDVLKRPFVIASRELAVTASVGVASSDGSLGLEEIVRNADTAMYAAKERGKGSVQAYEEAMHQRVLDRLELTGELRHALDTDQFELAYQPIVELANHEIVGVEALVRWRHPTRGLLAPAKFIGLAEQSGMIVPLGRWILQAACTQLRRWQLKLPRQRQLRLCVNVSPRQLREPDFADDVAAALRETGLSPSSLTLEITETVLADNHETILVALSKLKALGTSVAVDDFGTGYSALSHLRQFPIDVLKIDKSFVQGIERDHGKTTLVGGIVHLGGLLGMEVIAEGIEHPAQADELRAMDVRLGQGYLFSPPVAHDEMTRLLESRTPAGSAALAASH